MCQDILPDDVDVRDVTLVEDEAPSVMHPLASEALNLHWGFNKPETTKRVNRLVTKLLDQKFEDSTKYTMNIREMAESMFLFGVSKRGLNRSFYPNLEILEKVAARWERKHAIDEKLHRVRPLIVNSPSYT